MTRPYRFLSAVDKPFTVAEPPEAVAVETDFIAILAALLCAMICVAGLIAVARCAWHRRGSVDSGSRNPDQRSPKRGMKKKTIEVLPKFTYDSDNSGELSCTECAICLSEYATGDEIRVLPVCGHGFHVECVDKWLISQSSCPSCRQVLVSTRCNTCGEFPTVSLEAEEKCRRHSSSSSSSSDYLP